MDFFNCKYEVRDEENQKVCYDTCESYQMNKKRRELARINRRKENFAISVAVDSAVRATGKKPVHRIKNYS